MEQHHVFPVGSSVAFADVLHGPAHRERLFRVARCAAANSADHQVWQRRYRSTDDVDLAGLVVVVVEFVGIVGVEVHRKGVLQHGVIGIGPGHDVIGARVDLIGDANLDRLLIAFVESQAPFMGDRGQQHAAVAGGIRPGSVACQPDRVGPAGTIRGR